MSIRGSNFENQHPFASDHALVWERCMPDGLLYGVDMSFTSSLFTLGTGFMLVAGRMFEITAAENISISPGSGYARVYVAIDTGGAATENSFDQVSFGVDYAATLEAFTELTQNEININQGAAVYQAEVAVLAIDSTGATAIERQMELVSPGAGTGAFAAIAVTYPAGSTVTVTDGKITYTAPNTNGAALFIIPYAATWTVTATDPTGENDPASETVEITTEGQSVSVELSFRVPSDYQEVEYIQNTGSAFIDTGISPAVNFSCQMRVAADAYGDGIFGIYKNLTGTNTAYRMGVYASPSSQQWRMSGGVSTATAGTDIGSVVFGELVDLEYEQSANSQIITGFGESGSLSHATAANNYCTFFRYVGGQVYTAKGKLAHAVIYNDGELVRDMWACYRKSDGVAGMWDRVSKTFLTNAGSGTFVVGTDI